MQQPVPIILPPQLLAALYENVLIDEGVDKTEPEIQHSPSKKNTVIIAASKNNELPADQQALLEAILKACRLPISDVEVLTDKDPISSDHKKISAHFDADNVILFGLLPSSILLPVYFPPFQIQAFQETKYLHAPSLDVVGEDKTLKLQLWQCLKQLFP